MVFGLPFHLNRFFRPTFLDAFGFSNTQLGDLFAVYGVVAMLSYFPGGVLADRFSARGLLTVSLLSTSLGGFYLATIPPAWGMAVLYGFWGFTTIFLFWGALIRAIREWGGSDAQGTAFGVLEAGRGLVAATTAFLAVYLLASALPADAALASSEEKVAAIQSIAIFYAAVTLAVAVLVWLWLPAESDPKRNHRSVTDGIVTALGRPVLWAQAAVIIFAYCGYKGVDNYGLYARDVLGMNDVQGARLTALAAYLRPVAALLAGILADRISPSRVLAITFGVMILTYAGLSLATPDSLGLKFIFANLFVSLFAVFALRGVYFALLEEGSTPRHLTGTAVGLVSFVGFTPDIFFAPLAGRILDAAPGAQGHLNLFAVMTVLAACGLVAVIAVIFLKRRDAIKAVLSRSG